MNLNMSVGIVNTSGLFINIRRFILSSELPIEEKIKMSDFKEIETCVSPQF